MNSFGEKVSFIWSVADLLRGPYRSNQYKHVMLPMTVLRRLDCVLETTQNKVHAKLKSLEAAAGALGDVRAAEPDGWVEPNTKRRLRSGMFVAQVLGRSMEPRIPDGDWCLFQSPVEGGRPGRLVLVQPYTVKRHEGEQETDGAGSWRHTKLRLLPENPDFTPIILRDVRDDEFHVIAEAVEVLTSS